MTRDYRETAERLRRLAEDQKGKPEGDVAATKLEELLAQHPELHARPATQAQNPAVKIDPLWVVAGLELLFALLRSGDDEDDGRKRRKRMGL